MKLKILAVVGTVAVIGCAWIFVDAHQTVENPVRTEDTIVLDGEKLSDADVYTVDDSLVAKLEPVPISSVTFGNGGADTIMVVEGYDPYSSDPDKQVPEYIRINEKFYEDQHCEDGWLIIKMKNPNKGKDGRRETDSN